MYLRYSLSYLLLFRSILITSSHTRTYTGFKTNNTFCLSIVNNKMDDGQFPKEFIPHLNLGDYGSSRSYYAILYKNNTKQSKFTIEVESNATTGYSWYSVGIYEKAAIPNEPYQDSLKNIIDNDFVKRKISEGSTLDGLSVTPFDYSSSPSAHGVVGTSGVSKATISASSECKSGDYLVLLSYAQPFSPLTNCYYKKIYVRII